MPKNSTDLGSFCGLANQLGVLTPQLVVELSPLHGLLSSKNEFLWHANHDIAFRRVKELLLHPRVMVHFNPELPTRLITDASKIGIGYVLQQQHEGQAWKTVQCGSKMVTDCESRYAAIELELLAIASCVV